MQTIRDCLVFYCLLVSLLTAPLAPAQAQSSDRTQLNQPGQVLLLRHALAPGTGDPAEFQLAQCTTQRNLNETGREQAKAIGQWLRAKGVKNAKVYSSQWCRCLETASLLGYQEPIELPALNSFYQNWQLCSVWHGCLVNAKWHWRF